MLDTIKKGYASDPPHMAMYLPTMDMYGRPMVDSDGLILYRSLRGTSNLESLHQYLTTSFGHTTAAPGTVMCSYLLCTTITIDARVERTDLISHRLCTMKEK